MINLEKKAEELAEKYGDPGKGAEGRYLHERKALYECCPPVLGVVTDNRDPEGLGRVRVSTDMSVPGSASTCHRKGAGIAEPWCWKERR